MIYKIDPSGDCSSAIKMNPILENKIISGMVHCNNESNPFYGLMGKIIEIRTDNDRCDVYNNDSDIEFIIDFHMGMETETINNIIEALQKRGCLLHEDGLKAVTMSCHNIEDIMFGLFNNTERG